MPSASTMTLLLLGSVMLSLPGIRLAAEHDGRGDANDFDDGADGREDAHADRYREELCGKRRRHDDGELGVLREVNSNQRKCHAECVADEARKHGLNENDL